jgi:hypothetical protein
LALARSVDIGSNGLQLVDEGKAKRDALIAWRCRGATARHLRDILHKLSNADLKGLDLHSGLDPAS